MQIVFLKKYTVNHNSIIVNVLLKINNKNFILKDEPDNNDILGYTYFNNDSLKGLKRLKKEYPNNKIIVGGIGVYQNYHNIFRYADYCYFGDAYMFNENQILEKSQLGNSIKYNNYIPYEKMPFVKHTSSRYELITEKGCTNRCEFCQISHVQDFSIMPQPIFKNKVRIYEENMKSTNLSFLNSDGLINYKNVDLFKLMFSRSLQMKIKENIIKTIE